MKRYSRHIVLSEIGQAGQNKLLSASVLVIGAGGLGCPVLQYLAAAGIGVLGIMDHDTVSLSNLQRQILFGTNSIGMNKAIAAKKRLQDLNDTIIIKAYPEELTYKNALELFQKYDLIVDATDTFTSRYLINDAAIITQKPLVYGAIYKFEGQVAVFNYQNGPSYRCLFPVPPEEGSIPNCSEIGVLGVLPGIIGSLQANEVLKIILNIGNILSGKILYYNSMTNKSSLLTIQKSEAQIFKVLAYKEHFENEDKRSEHENIPLCANSDEISISELQTMKNIQFIDVREVHELPKIQDPLVTNIPLSLLENYLDQLDFGKKKILFCQVGIRSKKAVTILKKHKIEDSYSLREGASELAYYLSKTTYQEKNES